MITEDAHEIFIKKSSTLIARLEQVMKSGGTDTNYPNAEILLRNLVTWRELAEKRQLYDPLRPNFGASKSDLVFGAIDDEVRELESFYSREIFAPLHSRNKR